MRDRFGPLPLPLENLVELTKLRALALAKTRDARRRRRRRLTLGVGAAFALGSGGDPEASVADQEPLSLRRGQDFGRPSAAPASASAPRAFGCRCCAGSGSDVAGVPCGRYSSVERSSGPAREPGGRNVGPLPRASYALTFPVEPTMSNAQRVIAGLATLLLAGPRGVRERRRGRNRQRRTDQHAAPSTDKLEASPARATPCSRWCRKR